MLRSGQAKLVEGSLKHLSHGSIGRTFQAFAARQIPTEAIANCEWIATVATDSEVSLEVSAPHTIRAIVLSQSTAVRFASSHSLTSSNWPVLLQDFPHGAGNW